MAKLRALWINVNQSYWFYPALLSLAAAALAFLTVWLDRAGYADWLSKGGWIIPAEPDGARNVLNVISGSMIGVASTVFSITIAAVVYASGNYGPRLLTNFMKDRGNQISLAVFIATFVYSVLVIRTVRSPGELIGDGTGFVPQLSLIAATVFMMISICVLVYFLNHIPSSIRINSVLSAIGEEAVSAVQHRYPLDNSSAEPLKQPDGEAVTAEAMGYVQIIDFERLGELAKRHKCRVAMSIRTGDFIHPDMGVFQLIDPPQDDDEKSAFIDDLQECLSCGAHRTPVQDIEFLLDELVEIALRALSPGINDPFTAITSLHWTGAAVAELSGRSLNSGPEQTDYDPEWLIPMADNFSHFVQRSFGSMRSSTATSPLAAIKFLETLRDAATGASNRERIGVLRTEGIALMQQARLCLKGPDLEELETRFDTFGREMAIMNARK